MFASKEVEELGLTVGDLLEETAASSVFLDQDGNEIDFHGDAAGERGPHMLCWEDVAGEVEAKGLQGSFVTFEEAGYEMWIPDDLTPGQLPEGQPGADTFIGYYTAEAEDAYASVQYLPSDMTLDQYQELLETLDEVEGIASFTINGDPFLLYLLPANDSMSLTTAIEGKGLLEFTFSPIEEGDFIGLAKIMSASIRKAK